MLRISRFLVATLAGLLVLPLAAVVVGGGTAAAATGIPQVYVADSTGDAIREYTLTATGNTAPVATLAGAATALDAPIAVAVDAHGDLWVANSGSPTVTEYP